MAERILSLDEIINGVLGTLTISKDGRTYEVAELTSLNVDAEILNEEKKVLNKLTPYVKPTGVKFTGTATIYYSGSNIFNVILEEYQKTKKMPVFNATVTNNDPAHPDGPITRLLTGLVITSINGLIKLDIEDTGLTQDIAFAAENIETI